MSKFPNINKTVTEKSAKTVNDAIIEALNELGVTKDDVNVDIIDEGKNGFLGLGRKDAVVRVSIKESVIEAAKQAVQTPKHTEIKGEKRAPKNTVKEKPVNTEKTVPKSRPVKLPPERRSTAKPTEKAAAVEPVKAAAPELTSEQKAAAAKIFAQPEVRHPKKQNIPKKGRTGPERTRNERRIKQSAAPKVEPKPPTPKKISGIPPQEIAYKFLSDIFAAMQLDIKVTANMESDDALLVNLDGENMGIIIGKRGDTLDSLQYLTSLVVNQQTEGYIKITIDTENYREKRSEALISLSSRLAEKVVKTGKKFTLEPMNPYERRIIHANLQENDAVTTFSVGTEPYRKVVIAPKRERYAGGRPRRSNNSPRPRRKVNNFDTQMPTAEKKGSYTTTYKADFKPQQHKAEFKSFDDYLEAHKED